MERFITLQVESHIKDSRRVEPKYKNDPEYVMEYDIECCCCHEVAKIRHNGAMVENKYLLANLCPGCYEVRKEIMEKLIDPQGIFSSYRTGG